MNGLDAKGSGSLAKAYYWLYWALYQFDPFRAPAFDREWKTLVLICIPQILGMVALDAALGRVRSAPGILVGGPKWGSAALFIAVIALNYLAVLHGGRWKPHAATFEQTATQHRRKRAAAVAWAILACTIGISVYVVYACANRLPGPEQPPAAG